MIENKENWKEFLMTDIFFFSKGKRLTKANMITGNLNYIGAISDNNGVRQLINSTPTHEGNCITVNYNGSVGEAFYQKDPFWASDDVNVLNLKDQKLTQNIAIFLCTIIKTNKYRFGYGRKLTLEKMKNTYILLPVNEALLPNWQYMENYIQRLMNNSSLDKSIKTSTKSKKIKLEKNGWKEFLLSDFFICKRGKRLTKENREFGNIPLVTAGEGNLGVKEFISNNQEKFSNAITIDMFCNSYTNLNNFCCDDNILVLQPKNEFKNELDKYVMLFITTLIKKDKYRYQYGRQYRQKNYKLHSIKLPSSNNKEPDWAYMKNYISSLPYAEKI